jgi:hypothetical protein
MSLKERRSWRAAADLIFFFWDERGAQSHADAPCYASVLAMNTTDGIGVVWCFDGAPFCRRVSE